MAFWDSGATVLLCADQPGAGVVRRILRAHRKMVVWWGTPVEISSALARLQRDGLISGDEHAAARKRLAAAQRRWFEVAPTHAVRAIAQELPSRHGLRTADALQLAAALVWCSERPRKRPFVCLDERLGAAAEADGFMLVRPA